MKKFFFDCGANDGSSMIKYTNNPNNIVIAFEPTPKLVDELTLKYGHLENYIIIPKAVSNIEGKSKFNISGQGDWGCSSLNNFNDNLNDTWKGRTDFGVTESIDVDVIRLDNFIEEHCINSIEYLHCDVQGNDLEVLMGLGKYIHIVKRGIIEMPTRHETKLYKNQKYLMDDAIMFLLKNYFLISKIEPNDRFNNEVNIHFEKNPNPLI